MSTPRVATVRRRDVLRFVLASSAAAGTVGVGAAQEDPTHEHPDELDEDGNAEALRDWLADSLEESIAGSVDALESGDYDRARERVGEGYDGRLEEFARVSRELDDDEDGEWTREDEIAGFEAIRDDQRAFIDAVEDYNETYEEYQEARDAGDDQRAQQLARELEDHHETARESGAELEDDLAAVSDGTGRELDDELASVQAIRADIEERQEAVRADEFIETVLTADVESEAASFLDPLVITGRLRTVEGESHTGEATFRIEGREQTVAIAADGRFTFTHRPTTTPLETEQLLVEFVPTDELQYLGSEATVPIAVEQVEPTIDIHEEPGEVAFGDEVAVSGSVAADGIGAEGVPVAIEIGGTRLGTTTTDEEGAYELLEPLPAGASPGEVTVESRVAMSDRALAATTTSVPATVLETDSELTVDAEPAADSWLDVTGRLTTADGDGVGGQPIDLRVEGATVDTVETDADGRYEGTVPTSHVEGTGEPREVGVDAVYGGGGNVRESRASTTVELVIDEEVPAQAPGIIETILGVLLQLFEEGAISDAETGLGDRSAFGPAHLLALLGTVVGLSVGGYLLARRLGLFDDDDDPEAVVAEEASEPTAETETRDGAALGAAREHLLDEDPRRAIEAAYFAARGALADREDGTGRTHREFYQLCRSNGFSRDELAALEALTDQYERAAFAPGTISRGDAERAIAAAERFAA